MRISEKIEIPIAGMDCMECTEHVQHAIAALPGVASVNVLLASEKAIITLDPARVNLEMLRNAVAGAGYSVRADDPSFLGAGSKRTADEKTAQETNLLSSRIGMILLLVFGAVLFVVIAGEWLGLFEQITTRFPLGL